MEVEMKEKKVDNKVNNNNSKTEGKQLSKEQVAEICNQLIKENQQLKAKCNELISIAQYKRVDYLFAVLNSSYPFEKEFRDTCAKELMIALTPVEEKEDTKEKDKKD